ncbi:MAG: beta-glucosidase BglX [Gammaproteobacteria bacterium]|nr:beta-glucosidase BglX [Gammaproteobacteria bacterium]
MAAAGGALALLAGPAHRAHADAALANSPVPVRTGIYDPRIDARVDALLKKMTLDEKVGQLAQYSAGQPTGPGTGRTDYNDMLAKGQIGALFNISTARETNAYQRVAVEKSRLHIPVVFGLDVIHGFRTEFPIPLGLASSWDPGLVEQAARVAAREASATGIRWTFSPMVDIARDARWGRMAEGAGEDPYLGSAMAAAYVRGYQGERLDAPDSIAACAKHYVGYGAAEGGRDYNSTEISEHTLRQYYLPPFHAAVNVGSATIMSAFNSLNGVPASANPFTLTQVLRNEWGFRGVVDSDWTSIAELIAHGIANDGATAARKGFMAGVDMDMASSLYHDHLAELVRSGQVPMARVDEAVRRVLRLKFALGLFEHPYVDESQEAGAMLRPEYVALARTAAERSLVLLKNAPPAADATPLLPLASDLKNIALIGPLADDPPNMLGSWAGLGRAQDVTSLHAALAARIGEAHLLRAHGAGILDGSDADIATAVATAAKADVVILALGEDAGTMTGEAASRSSLGLPGRQQELLEKIVATGRPVVLLLFSGRPLTLPWAFEHVPAVLAAWFPGIQAGPALVDTLFGDANPSGRLVVSWPRSVGQEPLYYNALNTGRPATAFDLTKPPVGGGDEKYVSRYIDQQNSPQFPFGYGLSYTSFSYGPLQLDAHGLSAAKLNEALRRGSGKAVVTASAAVTNSGTRAGVEVVQLYVGLRGTSVAQPVRALAGFQRIALAPGETKQVTFDLGPEAFALWDAAQHHAVEPSSARVWIGPDAAHGTTAVVVIGQ